MAKKKTELEVIENAVTLDDLRISSGILSPDMTVMLDRYGYGDQIGENYEGKSSVPVETAAEFLGKFNSANDIKSKRWTAYQAYLQKRRAELAAKRREKTQKQQDALIAREKKMVEQAAKARADVKAAALAAEAAKNPDEEPLSFDDWEAKYGD